MKPMKILFTHSKNVLLEMQSKILLHTKNYSVKSILLQITQITIYILRRISFQLTC